MIYKVMSLYKKYILWYNAMDNVLVIEKPIPVKEFVRLKGDIKIAGVKLNNIIVRGRD